MNASGIRARAIAALFGVFVVALPLFLSNDSAAADAGDAAKPLAPSPLHLRLGDGEPGPAAAPLAVAQPLTDPEVAAVFRAAHLPAPKAAPRRPAPRSPPVPDRAGKAPVTAEPSSPLAVTAYAPDGEVANVNEVYVVFSKPVVALGSVESEPAPPVTLTPPIEGTWRYIGTSAALFAPSGVPARATDYTAVIPAGTHAPDGTTLAAELRWTFSTPPPTLVVSFPDPSRSTLVPARADTVLFLGFDQRVDQRAIVEHAVLSANGRTLPLRLATEAEIAAEKERSIFGMDALDAEEADARVVAIRSVAPLPLDTAFTLTLPAGTPSAEGPRVTTKEQSFAFRTHGPLGITLTCTETPCRPDGRIALVFSNELDSTSLIKAVTASPSVPGLNVDSYRGQLSLRGAFAAHTDYTLTLAATLRDIYGQALVGQRQFRVTTGDFRPFLFGTTGPLTVLDPTGPATYTVTSQTHPHVDVEVRHVSVADWPAWVGWQKLLAEANKAVGPEAQASLPPPPGTLVAGPERTPDEAANASGQLTVDLGPGLSNRLGHVIVTARSPDDNARVATWVQATNLGITAMSDAMSVLVWVTDITGGKPVQNVEVSLSTSGANALTDADGLATLPLSDVDDPLIVAKLGADSAFLPFASWASHAWRRTDLGTQYLWHIINDRELYQPGEDVRFKGWVRKLRLERGGGLEPANLGWVSWRIMDEARTEVAHGVASVDNDGGFDVALVVPTTMHLGEATLELVPGAPATEEDWDGKQAVTRYVQVREFRRPDFEVTVQTDPRPLVAGSETDIDVAARYFAGGPVVGAPTAWTLHATPAFFQPPNQVGFHFGVQNPNASLDDAFWAGETSADGHHHLKVKFDATELDFPVTVEAEAVVEDVNRQAWAANTSLLLHPSTAYVGVRIPRAFATVGVPAVVELVVTDLDGAPLAGRPIEVRAVRVGRNGAEVTEVEAGRCEAVSEAGATRCALTLPQPGSHRIEVRVRDAAGRPNRTDVWLNVAGETIGATNDRLPELTLLADKDEYAPGDTAELLVVSRIFPTEGLLTTRRQGLLHTERFTMTGPNLTLKVPIAEADLPLLRARVDVIGPPGSRAPTAEVDLPVSLADRRLTVKVYPADATLAPGGTTTVAVEVTDARGIQVSDAEVAIWVVDESVLTLADYELANPLWEFYPRPVEGVEQTELRPLVHRGLPLSTGGAKSQTFTKEYLAKVPASRSYQSVIGGTDPVTGTFSMNFNFDAIEQLAGPARGGGVVRRHFTPLAAFWPALHTDAEGHAEAALTLPGTLTRYRIFAVVSHGVGRFGTGESVVTAHLPLSVRVSPPRFVLLGDHFELSVVVQNNTALPIDARVAVRAENAVLVGPVGRRVTVPPSDRVELRLPVVTDLLGAASFLVVAEGGGESDATVASLPVQLPSSPESVATYGQLDGASASQPLARPTDTVPGYGGLSVGTSSTALTGLSDAWTYLRDYPYLSAEQRASRVLAAVSLPSEPSTAAAVRAQVEADLAQLAAQQAYDGSFSLWEGAYSPGHNTFLSAYVALAMQSAKDAGYSVSDEVLAGAADFLAYDAVEDLPEHMAATNRDAVLGFSLYVRARLGDPAPDAARALIADGGAERLGPEAAAWLLALVPGDPALRRQLTNSASLTASGAHMGVAHEEDGHLLLSSSARTDAVVLDALLRDDPGNPLVTRLVEGLLASRRGGRWANTQENAWAIVALSRYFGAHESVEPDILARVWVGGRRVLRHVFRGRSNDTAAAEVPLDTLPHDTEVTLARRGAGRLYYRIGLRYAAGDPMGRALDRGFTVVRTYEGVNSPDDVRRDPSGTWHIRAGSLVRSELTLLASSPRAHVALVDPLPAGIEPLDPTLSAQERVSWRPVETVRGRYGWADHVEWHDDHIEGFATDLPAGAWQFDWVGRATTVGEFLAPPARAEEMYAPETFGRTAAERVIIEE